MTHSSRLSRQASPASSSILKTLAHRHRYTVTKMARKYQAVTATPSGPRRCFEARVERHGRKPLVARFGGIPLRRQRKAVIDDRPQGPARPRQRTDHQAPGGTVRVVRAARPGGSPPGQKARRPHPHGPAATRVGTAHGQETAQDPHRLRPLPHRHPHREPCHGMHTVTREPDARKRASPVRAGGRRKRTRLAGTSSAAYRNTSGIQP
jgi:hypothetical protein